MLTNFLDLISTQMSDCLMATRTITAIGLCSKCSRDFQGSEKICFCLVFLEVAGIADDLFLNDHWVIGDQIN